MLRLNGPQSNGRRYASLRPATHGIRVNSALMEMISLRILMRKTIFLLLTMANGIFGSFGCANHLRDVHGLSAINHSGERHGLERKNYETSGQRWNFKLYLQDSSGSRSPPPSSNTASSPEGETQLEMVWCQNKEKIPPSLLASEFKLLVD